MSAKKELTAAQTLKAIELQAESDEAARAVVAMSKEEIERELREAGIDLEAEMAKAAEIRKDFESVAARSPELPAGAAPAVPSVVRMPPQAPPRREGPMRKAWVLLVAATCAVALVVIVVRLLNPPQPIAPITPEMQTPATRAAALRDDALRKCAAEDYERCDVLLNEAAALDDRIDTDPQVVAARGAIAKARASVDAGRLK